MINIKARPFYLTDEQEAWVRRTLSSLTTARKLGQLFCVMGGDYAPERLGRMVAEGRVGGVLLRPVETASAIRERYEALDGLAPVPLLRAANLEEGGSGGMSDGTLFGWPMLAAATGDAAMAERLGAVCAVEGQRAGFNWTFSPVCDIDMNFRNPITNVRTYGSSPSRVGEFARRYAQAVQRFGMAACAKHFPGDGVDDRDQHLHPTYNTLDAKTWYETYGEVYKELIAHDLMSIMAGHIVQPAVTMELNRSLTYEECLPGSLCPELLRGVLREKFGFNGVICTDATIMGGYTMAMERRRALPASVMAGCDMLVFNTDFEEDFAFMAAAVEDGRLTHARLNEAVTRVLALKAKVCLQPEKREIVDIPGWRRECAERAITLVKNRQQDVLPVTPERYPNIRLIVLGRDDIQDGSVREIAAGRLREAGFSVETYQPEADELHGVGRIPPGRLTLYLANYEQASNQTSVRIGWCPKHALDMPRFVNEEASVFISLSNPYHLQDVPRVKTYINAYTATRAVIEACLEKLLHAGPFTGESPVDAFCGRPDTRL